MGSSVLPPGEGAKSVRQIMDSVLDHGDGNITDDVMSIRNLMNMNFDIKR